MKKLIIALTAVALCLGTAAPSAADHHQTGGEHEDHGQNEGEAAMPPMGAPEEMKALEAMNGEYDVKFYYKANPMSPEWTETEATATLSTVLDGAAQKMVFEGEMVGMPFTGIGLTAYDRETAKFQTTWVDSMGARLSMYTGSLADGELVVEGEDRGQGMTFQSRLTTYNMTDTGFDWKYEMSMDGTNYMETAKATYTKK